MLCVAGLFHLCIVIFKKTSKHTDAFVTSLHKFKNFVTVEGGHFYSQPLMTSHIHLPIIVKTVTGIHSSFRLMQ